MRVMPYYDHGGYWWVGGLFGLLVVIAIVAGVFLVVRQLSSRPPAHHGAPPPPPPAAASRAVEELDLRYARGEIDRNEYLQRRGDLTQGHGPLPPPAGGPPAAS